MALVTYWEWHKKSEFSGDGKKQSLQKLYLIFTYIQGVSKTNREMFKVYSSTKKVPKSQKKGDLLDFNFIKYMIGYYSGFYINLRDMNWQNVDTLTKEL